MFTGLVQTVGCVVGIERQSSGITLRIDCGRWPDRPVNLGESICVSGVCLTVASVNADGLGFDVVCQTLNSTKLGQLAVDDAVNLELAVTPTQPMGGHFVQGHVDGVGTVVEVRDDESEYRLTVEGTGPLRRYLIPKGAICVDGVSLTLAEVSASEGGGRFEVALIPSTLESTTLGQLRSGDGVNLEADMVVKSVVHRVNEIVESEGDSEPSGINRDLLERAGFLV